MNERLFPSDEALADLPVDACERVEIVFPIWLNFLNIAKNETNKVASDDDLYEVLLAWHALMQFISVRGQPNYDAKSVPEISQDRLENVKGTIKLVLNMKAVADNVLTKRRSKQTSVQLTARIAEAMGEPEAYVFEDTDFDKLQGLTAGMASIIEKTTQFSERHRQRLLSRLASFQATLTKTTSNLDTAIVTIIEIGRAAIQLGDQGVKLAQKYSEARDILMRTAERAPLHMRLTYGLGSLELGYTPPRPDEVEQSEPQTDPSDDDPPSA